MAMGFNVVAVDINDQALQTASAVGASETFNSRTCNDYVSKLRTVTAGGVHAAAVFTGARAAYKNAFQILRLGGLLMAVGIMNEPLEVNTLEFAMGKYRIKSENVGMPWQMKKAMDFTTKHKIAPEVQFRKLEHLGSMVAEMREGAATKRMVVNPWA
ncbi:hypothetical protein BHE90_015951 [Fusarium euwallaceae]|uniref:Alcohol dehydrogenase-like C-terminal domain-containing protein n=1 Tax=Fusarium euwallaceae TaxID=1147111 RepID=A0A430L1M3_9HYPO|nr:hypothetical protein BHE90_015951 [Fusarium euwallaceae]